MDREDNEKGRVIYKIVDGLVLGYLNRRKYQKAQLGIINDSLWLRRSNSEMPVTFTPTLHEKSLEDIIELFFHYGRFDIPSDFLFMEQQLRQISNQFTDCLVNFSQTNRRKMEDRHNRFLLQQRNRPNEMENCTEERNARLGEPSTIIPPLLPTRLSQNLQQSHAVKRKAQEEFVYPQQRQEITKQNQFERVENTFYEPLESADISQPGAEEQNNSFEGGSSRRKSRPHHLKSDVNTLVSLAATKAQQRLNKEVEDDNWDLGDQFDHWFGQLPPIEEFCMERLWEAAEQMEIPGASSSSQNHPIEQNSPTIAERSNEIMMESQRIEDIPIITPSNQANTPGKKISPKENSVKISQPSRDLNSPTFGPSDNHNASMEDLFGREDGEISNSPAKIQEEIRAKMARREEKPPRQPKTQNEPSKREDSFKIRPRTQSQQQRAPSTSSTASSIASRIEETPQKTENRQKVPEKEKERDKRREQDKDTGRQREKERIEREKQKERQKEREKLEKVREARRAKEEKEKQAKDRERKEKEPRRERDPQRKVDSYVGIGHRRDSRTQSSSSSIASEYEPEKERERDRRSAKSPVKEKKEKVKERAESSNSRGNSQKSDKREKEKREEHKDERKRSDSSSQIRKKEMENSSGIMEASPRTADKPKEMTKSKKPKINSQASDGDLFEAIGNKIDSNPAPKMASPRPVQASPAAGRAKHSDVLSQIFPDAAKFSSTTIKIPKMKLPTPVIIQPVVAPLDVDERENTPEKSVQMCIGFPETSSKNLITKSTMSDSRLACLLANLSKKRERMREEGLDLDVFDSERNDDDDRRDNSTEESSTPLETSDILENDQPPVKIRRKIDLEVAESVLSQIHGLQ